MKSWFAVFFSWVYNTTENVSKGIQGLKAQKKDLNSSLFLNITKYKFSHRQVLHYIVIIFQMSIGNSLNHVFFKNIAEFGSLKKLNDSYLFIKSS